jgi:anti-anti-sigma regulatory factor
VGRQRSIKSRTGKRRPVPAAPLPLEGMTFTLPADLGIEHAAALHATLAPLLATTEPVVLVAHDVCRLHTASLQVLAAFVRDRAAAGGPTLWRNPPAVMRESVSRLGLEAVLGLAAILI